jgi:hypothetical protein
MPLVDLTTNLKSLKYGRDTTNGGSSGEPFITKDINGLTIEDLGRTGGSDLLIRGGFLLPGRVADDVKRIGKYLSTPEGLLWSTTQNVLSASGVRIYGGYPTIAQTANVFRLNDGTYLPSSTLLQLAANPIGGHLNKQGTDPTGLSVLGRPEYVKLQRDLKTANLVLNGENELNRLIKLRKKHITGFSFGPIYSYLGGPGAGRLVGGAGKTDIRFADQRTPTYQQFNDPYFQITKDNIFPKLFKNKLSSNLIEVTTYGVSNTYGLNPEDDNKISRGNGLRFDEKTSTDKFYTEKRNISINRNSVLNLPNESPINVDGTPNPNFDPSSIKDIPTISGEYKENFNKEYKVKGGPEEVGTFDVLIPNPDYRFNQQTLPDSYPTKAEEAASLETSTTFNPDYTGVGDKNIIQDGDVILPNQQTNTGLNKTPTVIQDFRATKKNNKVKAPDYNDKNIEQRVNLGDPGNSNIDRSNYTAGGGSAGTGVDKINNMYLYRSNAVTTDSQKNDLVKFRIATIDPDEPTKKVFTHFRAFINSMSDSFSAGWDSFQYMGRGEQFYNYQGFSRSMRLSWTVMAQSKNELATQYQKLNYLASTLAPNYSDAGFMRGNIHQLTIGGYVYEYPGIIESLDFTIPDDSPWEIGISTSGGFDPTVKELPHRIEVAMSFKPIDKFLPQTQKNISGIGKVKERFLSLENGEKGDNGNLYFDVGNKKSVNVK